MPLPYRVPFAQTCGVFWTLYLSILNSAYVHFLIIVSYTDSPTPVRTLNKIEPLLCVKRSILEGLFRLPLLPPSGSFQTLLST